MTFVFELLYLIHMFMPERRQLIAILLFGQRARPSTEPHTCFIVLLLIFERSDVANTSGRDGPGIFFRFWEIEELLSERENPVNGRRGNGVVFEEEKAPG